MTLVSAHNEWDPLQEVILGTALGIRTPRLDVSLQAIEYPTQVSTNDCQCGPFGDRIVDETQEDLQQFEATLCDLGVVIRRPDLIDHSVFLSTQDWTTDGYSSYCPRDALLVVGDMIIEAPMPLRSRFLETFAYRTILNEYHRAGAKWLSAPKPRLLDSAYHLQGDATQRLSNDEPTFDAANVLRLGKDILYLVSNSGNELGAIWLQRILGDSYTVHPCRGLYASTHIDSTVAPLRPGLVLLNPERVNPSNLPAVFRHWDVLWCPAMHDIGFTGRHARSSKWIGMNLLMVNPALAIVDKNQIQLIKALEQLGIDVIPLQLRHARTLGGGFHCVTLDVRRSGELARY